MSTKEKLIKRLTSCPKDFTFSELETLLGLLTYHRTEKGRTSGSRVMFVSEHHCPILLHKPHGRKELLEYQVKQIIEILRGEGLL
ncbi:MAG: type II toxin-antitoxin system HicA family toxin [Anaerovoracaceae bacterium]